MYRNDTTFSLIKRVTFLVFITGFAGLNTGCDDKSVTKAEQIDLVVSPDTLNLSDNHPSGIFYISTQPLGDLTWRITSKPDWLQIDSLSGEVKSQTLEIPVLANFTDKQPGTYIDNIEILSDGGGEAELIARLTLGARPEATVSENTISFSETDEQTDITLTNTGTGYLEWNILSTENWLSVSPSYGKINSGNYTKITVSVNKDGLAPGTVSDTLKLQSNAISPSPGIPVTLAVPENPVLNVSHSSVLLNYFVDSTTFSITNPGNTTLNWNAQGFDTFISLSETSGSVPAGESISVTVSANRSELSTTGTHQTSIVIEGDNSQSRTVTVNLKHYEETKWLLTHQISDVEFDVNNDVLVSISENPSQLHVMDPATRTVNSVDLSLTPNCVSVHPDGTHAAVGHNGHISYVNLSDFTVEETYPVSTNALDIVLAANGWVYVFPKTDQWSEIHSVNLDTGSESTTGGIYAGTLAKLHPSGDYIYGADNGLSPSDFEKYDIRDGAVKYMYDSRYHGDYSFSGNIWISEDGKHLFARSGNVFRSSSEKDEDMFYAGQFEGINSVLWADHSTEANRVYAISYNYSWNSPNEYKLRVYEAEYLGLQGTVSLPQYLIPNGIGGGTFREAEPQYVFVNDSGTEFYVITKAESESDSELTNSWAIVPFDVDSTP